MTTRDDLDIEDLLVHYGAFIRGQGEVRYIKPLPEGESSSSAGLDGVLIRRVGWGPDMASSCTALAVLPGVIWDVNGWYRLLGVRPEAALREIREAYLDRGGIDDARLTYLVQQLRNKETRRRYDLMPLGSVFMDDAWVQMQLERQAATEASRRTAEGKLTSVREVLDEMGYQRADPAEDPPEDAQDEQEPPAAPWAYAWYRRAAEGSEAVMERWQALLAAELSRRGIVTRFAVGAASSTMPLWHDGKLIFFLNECITDPGVFSAVTAVGDALEQGLVVVSGT